MSAHRGPLDLSSEVHSEMQSEMQSGFELERDTYAHEMPRDRGDCRGSSPRSSHFQPQRWSAAACRLVAGRRRHRPRAHRGPDEGVHQAQSETSSGVIGGHQRAHQPQSEVSSAAIRGLISRNQRSHQPQSEVSSAAIRGLIRRTESKKTSLARLVTGGCASARSWRSPSAGAPPRPRKLPDDGRNQEKSGAIRSAGAPPRPRKLPDDGRNQ